MKNILILPLFLFACATGYAQITSVNTACTGVPINFTGPTNEVTYTWTTDTVDIDQTRSAFTTTGLTGFTLGTFASTNYDNGTWYTFINFHGNNTMRRLTYTSDPNGTYTVSTVGTFGTASKLEGIDIVKDPATGNWFGIAVNDVELYVLSFGNSLANAPTTTTYNFNGTMSWPHQVNVAKFGNNWIGFIGDRNSTIKRVDFGTSLTNTPTMTSIPNVGSASQPCNFAIRKENGNYYMLIANLINATVTRYDFGTNISNNTPTGTLLGNIGNQFILPRSICIVSDCNQLIAYVLNQSSGLIKLDFGQSITNTPTATATGNTGIASQNSLNTYFVDTAMYANIVSFGNVSLSRGKLLSFPSYNTTNYYNNSLSSSFPTTGTKNITLFVNQGSPMGSEAFCKTVNISNGTKILRDTSFCSNNDSLYLDASASGATGYLWNTNETTPGIYVKTTGKYWVTFSGPACLPADTATVTLTPKPAVFLGADTAFCNTTQTLGNKLPNPPGSTFLWSTFNTNPTITANTTGKYWLEVSNGVCVGRDTIAITVADLPSVYLGNDTIVCDDEFAILSNKIGSPAGAAHLWSDSTTGLGIRGTNGTYWLTVTHNGCEASDTINVSQYQSPKVILPADTYLCTGNPIVLRSNTQQSGSTYKWSNGSMTDSITVLNGGFYTLTVTADNGCDGKDDIAIREYKLPSISLGDDKDLCSGEIIRLPREVVANGNYSIKWQDGTIDTSFTPQKTGIYTATLIDICGVVSDEVSLKFTPCHLFFPSAFSPDGNGRNDLARIKGDLEGIQEYKLSIFNRWGQRVYSTTNPYEGWDGKFNGNKSGMDTYFYMIRFNYRGQQQMMKGNLLLTR